MFNQNRNSLIEEFLGLVIKHMKVDTVAGLIKIVMDANLYPSETPHGINPHDEQLIRQFFKDTPRELSIAPPNCSHVILHWRLLSMLLDYAGLQDLPSTWQPSVQQVSYISALDTADATLEDYSDTITVSDSPLRSTARIPILPRWLMQVRKPLQYLNLITLNRRPTQSLRKGPLTRTSPLPKSRPNQ
jgi:hypothetical protein